MKKTLFVLNPQPASHLSAVTSHGGMHKWNPAGVWAVWIMFHNNSEVPTFFSLAVELPQGREKGETVFMTPSCIQ